MAGLHQTKLRQPDRIHELFDREGETVKNDHIAFRTFNDPRVSIKVLAEPFIS